MLLETLEQAKEPTLPELLFQYLELRGGERAGRSLGDCVGKPGRRLLPGRLFRRRRGGDKPHGSDWLWPTQQRCCKSQVF